MKKILVFFCALSLVLCGCLSVSAATITKEEQAVLDVLNTKVQFENFEASFPNEIIVQAENFFLAEDITSSQAQKVIENLKDIISVVENNPKYISTPTDIYHSTHPRIREEIDERLNNIFGILNLSHSYDGKNVNIVNKDGVVYFSDEPIIKATGQTPSVIIPIVVGLLCGGVCFITLRRKVRG